MPSKISPQDEFLYRFPLDHAPVKNITHFREDLIEKVLLVLRNIGDVAAEGMRVTIEVDFRRGLGGLDDKPLVDLTLNSGELTMGGGVWKTGSGG